MITLRNIIKFEHKGTFELGVNAKEVRHKVLAQRTVMQLIQGGGQAFLAEDMAARGGHRLIGKTHANGAKVMAILSIG